MSKPISSAIGTVRPALRPVEISLSAPPPVSTRRLQKLKALVLLAGAVGPSTFSKVIGRSLLDLPIAEGRTILDVWRAHALRLSGVEDLERLPVRIVVNGIGPSPSLALEDAELGLQLETDPCQLRGTGGVLRDICDGFDSDDIILVATGAQVLTQPLAEAVEEMDALGGDVCLVGHRDGTPSSLMLVRCGSLGSIPKEGFVDLKEQGLPLVAAKHRVMVLHRATPVGLPVRTPSDYTRAVRAFHLLAKGELRTEDPFREQWETVCSIVEPGADVHSSARLHDSVVLRGGCVERGAVLVRSVVCPGGVVRRDATVTDQLVTSKNK